MKAKVCDVYPGLSSPLSGGGWRWGVVGRTETARALRRRPTDAERMLWKHLRLKQLGGLKFRRQEPIDGYIVDFVCYGSRVIIEADGGQHDNSESDGARDRYLQQQGFTVLRFWNTDILQNMQGVLSQIRAACGETPSP